jgi:hypothetical protein
MPSGRLRTEADEDSSIDLGLLVKMRNAIRFSFLFADHTDARVQHSRIASSSGAWS